MYGGNKSAEAAGFDGEGMRIELLDCDDADDAYTGSSGDGVVAVADEQVEVAAGGSESGAVTAEYIVGVCG